MASSRRRVLRICSWNVNGLRACATKGFSSWLTSSGCDVAGLQEVRAFPEQLPLELRSPPGLHTCFAPAERPGYSGVALYARLAPDDEGAGLGAPRFDVEGRFAWMRFGKLVVASGYFPKGNGPARDDSRVPYKLDFYRAVFDRAERWRRAGRRVLVLGDFNTAHRESDLARPASNRRASGFLPVERAELDRWFAAGWVDTFRAYEAGPGHYSWWAQRQGARARNVGWRVDYVLASANARPFLRGAFLSPDVRGSDHCPAGVDVDAGVCA